MQSAGGPAAAPRLGLVGGLGVGAAVHYYRTLARHFAAQGRTFGTLDTEDVAAWRRRSLRQSIARRR